MTETGPAKRKKKALNKKVVVQKDDKMGPEITSMLSQKTLDIMKKLGLQ